MGFMRDDVRDWLRDTAQVENDPVLEAMHAEAAERDFPIVGPEVGRLLFQLAHISGARRIFEMGSGFGYSTLWFARAMEEGGRVYHTDGSGENSARARDYLDQAGLRDRVVFTTGDAIEILEKTPGSFDIVFMDIDKHQYPDGYRAFRERIKPGGLVVVDNLVWDGLVASGDDDPSTEGIREYIRLMWQDRAFASSLMPVRDGVGVSLRLE
jgi:predicted O-methyltransferase YrrM